MSKETIVRRTGAQKMVVLLMRLKHNKSVSEICAESSIAPSQFYKWQDELFQNGDKIFDQKDGGSKVVKRLQDEISELKKQLSYNKQVMFELMEEHVKTNKKLGIS